MTILAQRAPMSNNIGQDNLTVKITRMADTMSPAEIARLTGMREGEVEAITAAHAAEPWWLRDNKTGRTWQCRSWRSAYLRVCLLGLTDWDCRRSAGAVVLDEVEVTEIRAARVAVSVPAVKVAKAPAPANRVGPAPNAERDARVKALVAEGLSVNRIAERLGQSRDAIYHVIRRLKLQPVQDGMSKSATGQGVDDALKYLAPRMSAILRAIRDQPGITSAQLGELLYPGKEAVKSRKLAQVVIMTLRKHLARFGVEIESSRSKVGGYRIKEAQ